MSSDNEQYRAGFEAWARKETYSLELDDEGHYLFSDTLAAWGAWIGSKREASPQPAAQGELPPLPESDWVLAGSANNRDAYTADQMREYGQQCRATPAPTAGEASARTDALEAAKELARVAEAAAQSLNTGMMDEAIARFNDAIGGAA